MSHSAQRLGKNRGAYLGETIDINQILRDDLDAARKFGWQIEEIPVSDQLDLLAFRLVAVAPRRRPYLFTRIHGDEPARPLPGLRVFLEDHWPPHALNSTLPRP